MEQIFTYLFIRLLTGRRVQSGAEEAARGAGTRSENISRESQARHETDATER